VSDLDSLASPQKIVMMMTGAWIAQAVAAAAELGIADHIGDEPVPAAQLAKRCGAHSESLYRLMRALASVGVFAEAGAGRFTLTPLAAALRSDAPDSVRAYAMMAGAEWQWRSWGRLADSVRTGTPAFKHVFGMPIFDYYALHPEAQRISAEGLTSRSVAENAAIAKVCELPAARTIVDIGGGEGTLLVEILRNHPSARGVLLERTAILPAARATFEKAGLAGRCTLVDGDFFAGVPSGADVYLLKKVIHDWPDERARIILANCRAAMPKHARLLLIDFVVPPGNGPSYAKFLDLLMLVYAGGRERTEAEHRALLASAGLALDRIIPTSSGISIIEAKIGPSG
jgi:hypothetical protein